MCRRRIARRVCRRIARDPGFRRAAIRPIAPSRARAPQFPQIEVGRMVCANFRAAMLMVVSMVLFAFEDMCIKLLTATLPYAQVLGMIGLLGWFSFWIMLRRQGGRLWTRALLDPLVLLRNLAEAVGSIGIVVALALTELSSTSAIMQALPWPSCWARRCFWASRWAGGAGRRSSRAFWV
ncbi:hypothetical protein [Paracoccus mutanolyticus]|uniref:hypothetical protein n=1 Tax=Paracoccus mutanolyticus TaxID=1499308 RepID=UPI0029500507|nr:hypothetical protein [Paracoccus mutanolyticus]